MSSAPPRDAPPPEDAPLSDDQLDPTYVHARREAAILLVVFAVALLWAVGVSYREGYMARSEHARDQLTILGMPTWVFWGIVVPWLVIDIFTAIYCFFIMADDDLGAAHEGQDLAEQIEHEHQPPGGPAHAERSGRPQGQGGDHA